MALRALIFPIFGGFFGCKYELSKYCILFPYWPPNSPDLNPIEVIWAIMKRRLKTEGIKTRHEAEQVLRDEWEHLIPHTVNGLVHSFETRVQMVRDAKGQTIQPLLSAGKYSVPPDYLPDCTEIAIPEPWTSEEDQFICALIEEFEVTGQIPNWRHLARTWVPLRDWRLIRNRFNLLKTRKETEQQNGFFRTR